VIYTDRRSLPALAVSISSDFEGWCSIHVMTFPWILFPPITSGLPCTRNFDQSTIFILTQDPLTHLNNTPCPDAPGLVAGHNC
jgi:hypothetical protein